MRAIFRVDSSFKIGTGHIRRCIALGQTLKKNGVEVSFICRKHEGNLIHEVKINGFNTYELELINNFELDSDLPHAHLLGSSQKKDAEDCINILKLNKTDWLIVDHYALDEKWEKKLKNYYKKLIIIDDLADRKHLCNILIDQTLGRKKEDYTDLVPSDCQLLIGPNYALLRSEFAEMRNYSLKRRAIPKFKNLLISMGGYDIDNMTLSVLRELINSKLPKDIIINIIMSKASMNYKKIKSISKELPYKVNILSDINNVSEILSNSDIAIGAAGASTWERCCVGLPTIQIAIAKNQEFLLKMLSIKNLVKTVEEMKDISYFLETRQEWMKRLSILSSKVCDGRGSINVYDVISNQKMILDKFGEILIFNYINLNDDEKKIILKMRNHPNIKRWMYNQKNISVEEHFEFINKLRKDNNKNYFLIKQKEKVLGTINFIKNNYKNSLNLGIYSNPLSKINNSGTILIIVASKYAFEVIGVDKITLEVFSDNKKAINFYKKNGFHEIQKKFTSHEIICMEKKRYIKELN